MLRSMGALVAVMLALTVGYFVYNDKSERSNVEKARAAVGTVGGKVVDQGVAGLVKVRLGKEFGIDAARFLHVHHERGHTLIYGLLPDSIDAARVRDTVADIPGVESIEVRVMPHTEPEPDTLTD